MFAGLAKTDRDAANRYGWVVGLLCVVYIVTVSWDGPGNTAVIMLAQLATMWLAFSASESHDALKWVGLACVGIALIALATFGLGLAMPADDFDEQILSVMSVLVYLVAPVVIFRHLIRRPAVDVRTVLGAVAIYLMLGIAFAFTYRSISLFQSGTPFFGVNGHGDNADFMFFSFITLTTTGYGDLVPVTNPGQTVAVAEAILGQLFLVTALAKIVNAWRVPGINAPQPPEK